ncbi:MAG TPA: hypothetical protein VJ732_06600, partial [Bryobacteraceae bacterium]|nr:hypothetical protein [Bryobacteraceae bacterium]
MGRSWKAGLAALLLPLAAGAQVLCSLGANRSAYNPNADERPSPDALELAARLDTAVKSICAAHCPAIALFRNDTASQLMLLANAGQAKLVYEPKFFSAAYDQYGDGAILALLAHAIGHGLDDAMGAAWIQSGWPAEVRADSWGGCELGKARLSAPDLAGALGALAKFPPAG